MGRRKHGTQALFSGADRGRGQGAWKRHLDRRHLSQDGITEATFYRWKKDYGGLEPDQVRELKPLREENERLKKLVAELSLDKAMLQDINRRKG